MSVCHAKIINIITDSAELVLNENDGKLPVQANSDVRLRMPNNPSDNTLLMELNTHVAGIGHNCLDMRIVNTIEFELDSTPEDYLQFAQEVCVPMAQQRQRELINKVFEGLGYKSLFG